MRIGVLVSGEGTNLQALIDAQARGSLAPGVLACVVSNRANAPALARATAAGLPAVVIDHHGVERAVFEAQIDRALATHGVELVVLAGFMRVLTPAFTDRYPRRIINTHPSLLPAFAGLDAPGQAIAHGVKLSGLTIHFVDATLDGGPIIAQVAVPVEPGDDATALHARIRREEHRLLPVVVQQLASGALTCTGRHVSPAAVEGLAHAQ